MPVTFRANLFLRNPKITNISEAIIAAGNKVNHMKLSRLASMMLSLVNDDHEFMEPVMNQIASTTMQAKKVSITTK